MKYILFILIPFAAFGQNQRNEFSYFNEFLSGVSTTESGLIYAINSGSGSGSSSTASTASGLVGLLQTSTGTATSGYGYVGTGSSTLSLGGGIWEFEVDVERLSALCDGTNSYALLVGFFDTQSADQTDGVYFLYDSIGVSTGSASSDRWQCVTASNSTRTLTETSTDVSTSGAKLHIGIDADGTHAYFYIDESLVATHITNIPTGAGREMGFGWMLIKSAGTSARTMNVDYLECTNRYTTPK